MNKNSGVNAVAMGVLSSDGLSHLIRIVRMASVEVLAIYNQEFTVKTKQDQSPVTDADLVADRIITNELETYFPQIPIVTEECIDGHMLENPNGLFFLVDPIDGTKEFIKRTGEFTINIALINNNRPIAGVVYAPALGRMFAGIVGGIVFEENDKGHRTQLRCRQCETENVTAVSSVSHQSEQTKTFLKANNITDCIEGGSSLKFCLLAAGEADIYPRHSPTMEWDTAAGDAILRAAGGHVLTCDDQPLNYGKPDFKNPFFIASSADVNYIHP